MASNGGALKNHCQNMKHILCHFIGWVTREPTVGAFPCCNAFDIDWYIVPGKLGTFDSPMFMPAWLLPTREEKAAKRSGKGSKPPTNIMFTIGSTTVPNVAYLAHPLEQVPNFIAPKFNDTWERLHLRVFETPNKAHKTFVALHVADRNAAFTPHPPNEPTARLTHPLTTTSLHCIRQALHDSLLPLRSSSPQLANIPSFR